MIALRQNPAYRPTRILCLQRRPTRRLNPARAKRRAGAAAGRTTRSQVECNAGEASRCPRRSRGAGAGREPQPGWARAKRRARAAAGRTTDSQVVRKDSEKPPGAADWQDLGGEACFAHASFRDRDKMRCQGASQRRQVPLFGRTAEPYFSTMIFKISRSVSRMPSRAMRLTLRIVSSTPMVTMPSPAKNSLPFS